MNASPIAYWDPNPEIARDHGRCMCQCIARLAV